MHKSSSLPVPVSSPDLKGWRWSPGRASLSYTPRSREVRAKDSLRRESVTLVTGRQVGEDILTPCGGPHALAQFCGRQLGAVRQEPLKHQSTHSGPASDHPGTQRCRSAVLSCQHFCVPRHRHARDTGKCLETCLLCNWGRRCCLYLVGRGQGCCSTPHNAQDAPHRRPPSHQLL